MRVYLLLALLCLALSSCAQITAAPAFNTAASPTQISGFNEYKLDTAASSYDLTSFNHRSSGNWESYDKDFQLSLNGKNQLARLNLNFSTAGLVYILLTLGLPAGPGEPARTLSDSDRQAACLAIARGLKSEYDPAVATFNLDMGSMVLIQFEDKSGNLMQLGSSPQAGITYAIQSAKR